MTQTSFSDSSEKFKNSIFYLLNFHTHRDYVYVEIVEPQKVILKEINK